jgi:c-di-GMP-binding flagellar brake protein YcgR
VEEYWSGKERRSHPRFRQKLDVEYTLEKRPNLKAKGYTIDISEGGLKVLMDEKLAKGTSLEFVITLPGKKSPAQIKSEVIWLEEAKAPGPLGKRMFYYGVRFLAIKEPGGSSLLNYIRSIQLSS